MSSGITRHRGYQGEQPSRAAGLRSIVAGAAVVGALGGAWALGSHLAAGNVAAGVSEQRKTAAPASFAERAALPERASFSDRFAPAMTDTAAAKPADTAQFAALFDPAPAIGAATGSFRKALPSAPAGWSATQTAEIAAPRLAPAQPPKQVALNLPQGAPQPLILRTPEPATGTAHERLVRRATAKLLASAATGKASIFEKLLGKLQPAGPVLAYAGPDSGMPGLSPSLAASTSAMDRVTAIYDISKRVVYMPDGSKLEAHSGLGSRLDDPDYAHERMRGVTPPHIYDLKPREALFHGVPALRMTPIGGEGAIHGRSGILAHTYMLGPNGQSNGCISFKDYYAFLKAYRNGDIKRIVVVGKLD